jgi:hypothetical protein
MSDKLFFPLAAVVASAFVFVALDPFADRPPRGPVSGGGSKEDVTVSGKELHRFLPGDAGGLSIEDGAQPVVRISRMAEQVYASPRSGPHIVLAEDLEYAFEARPIEVSVEARSVGEFAAANFEVDYMARNGAESGWHSFGLTREFATYSFDWTTPSRGKTEGYDFLGVRPVAPDKRRTMEIRSIHIRAIGPKAIENPL